MYLTDRSRNTYPVSFHALGKDEKITSNDFVEDLATGRRESVSKGYWAFLRGQRVEQALQLPEVFDVVRANA